MELLPPSPHDALLDIARLRTDGSRARCQYCECDAGGGLYADGIEFDDHEEWCPSVLACKALGLARLNGESRGV
jgi:hypothetical protein